MTYEELMQAFIQGGGMLPGQQGEGSVYAPRPVTLPDGRTLMMSDTGQIIDYGAATMGAGSAGGGAPYTATDPAGGTQSGFQSNGDGDAWKTSLLGALGVGVGGPLAGGLAAGAFGGAGAAAAPITGEALMPAVGGGAATAPTVGGGAGTGLLSGAGTALSGVGGALASNPGLAGAAIGAIAGVAGNQPETQTNTQGLPAWMQPYAESSLARANALSSQPFQPYGAPMVAGASGDQENAYNLIRQNANTGDALVNQARGQQSNVISGGVLNSNPYLDQVANNIGNRMGDAYALGTRGNLSTRQAMAGGGGEQFNSSAKAIMGQNDRSFGDSLGSTLSNLYAGNYQNERQAQDAASRASLGFSSDWRANTEGLLNAGTQQQGNQQANYDATRAEWDRGQAWPTQSLGILQNAINPQYGSQQSSTTPAVPTWQAMLGGALGGAQTARSVFGGQSNSTFGNTSPWSSQQLGQNNGNFWGGW